MKKTISQRFYAATRRRFGAMIAVLISLAITAFFAFAVIKDIRGEPLALLDDLEHLASDLRLQYAGVKQVAPSASPSVFVIDIDDKSLDQEGRWPWNRQKMARLTAQLQQANVAVISFDIQFPEHTAKQFLQSMVNEYHEQKMPYNKEFETLTDWIAVDDKKFAMQLKASRKTNTVIGFFFQLEWNALRSETQTLAPTSIRFHGHPTIATSTLAPKSYLSSLTSFQQAATGNGFMNIKDDRDGVVRRAQLLMRYKQQLYPSLALETLRVYKQQQTIDVYQQFNSGSGTQDITHILVGSSRINTDANGAIILPYTGAGQRFPSYSATDVLQQKLSEEDLKGLANSIVFIGSSAPRLKDVAIVTPFESSYSGLHLQAMITQALLHPETIPVEPRWMSIALLVVLSLLGIVLSIGFAFSRIQYLMVMVVVLPLLFIWLAVYLWQEQQISLPLVIPLLLMLFITLTHISQRVLQSYQRKRAIQTMFDQYVPASHIQRLLDEPNNSFEGDKRTMSVLFADIRSFTQLSEQLTTEQIKQLLNCYFTHISKKVFHYEGTIDKFVGDMVMAFWNAPSKDEHHAKHAIQTALAMLVVTQNMKTVLAEEKLPAITLEIGIGISTGIMNVGDMGSKYRRAYTVIGDTVNIGSRLESLTKFYHVPLLVTEATKKACEANGDSPWLFRYIDCVRVKGKQESLKIYDILGETETVSHHIKKELMDYELAIDYFLKADWLTAQLYFKQLHQQQPDTFLYQHYLQRIEHLQANPNDWDGVYRFLAK